MFVYYVWGVVIVGFIVGFGLLFYCSIILSAILCY